MTYLSYFCEQFPINMLKFLSKQNSSLCFLENQFEITLSFHKDLFWLSSIGLASNMVQITTTLGWGVRSTTHNRVGTVAGRTRVRYGVQVELRLHGCLRLVIFLKLIVCHIVYLPNSRTFFLTFLFTKNCLHFSCHIVDPEFKKMANF